MTDEEMMNYAEIIIYEDYMKQFAYMFPNCKEEDIQRFFLSNIGNNKLYKMFFRRAKKVAKRYKIKTRIVWKRKDFMYNSALIALGMYYAEKSNDKLRIEKIRDIFKL